MNPDLRDDTRFNRIIYPCRANWGGVVMVTLLPLIPVIGGILLRHWHPDFLVFGVFMGVFAAVFLPAYTLPCRYILNADNLVIQTGVVREHIPLARIKGAVLTGMPDAVESPSTRRVRLMLDTGHRLVSPRNRKAFIKELKARAYL